MAHYIPDHHSHETKPSDSFGAVIELPDSTFSSAYDRLVGLDVIKHRLLRDSTAMIRPQSLAEWSERQYGRPIPAVDLLREMNPMFIFAGDVGTGKTALAESFGSRLGEQLGISVHLYRLSFRVRGTGLVGEMSTLIEQAFREIADHAHDAEHQPGEFAHVLVIDEADSLAQSREAADMHHEDRAGVNTLIRSLDATGAQFRLIVVLCTNRLDTLDPAIVRRARAIFEFARPDHGQRRQLLAELLAGTDLSERDIDAVADATQLSNGCRFTYSDIANRIVPEAILNAWPEHRLSRQMLLDAVANTAPTPGFRGARPQSLSVG